MSSAAAVDAVINPSSKSRVLTILSFPVIALALGVPWWIHTTSIERRSLAAIGTVQGIREGWKDDKVAVRVERGEEGDVAGWTRMMNDCVPAENRAWELHATGEDWERAGSERDIQAPRIKLVDNTTSSTSPYINNVPSSAPIGTLMFPINSSQLPTLGTLSRPTSEECKAAGSSRLYDVLETLLPLQPWTPPGHAIKYAENVTLSFVLLNEDSSAEHGREVFRGWDIEDALHTSIPPLAISTFRIPQFGSVFIPANPQRRDGDGYLSSDQLTQAFKVFRRDLLQLLGVPPLAGMLCEGNDLHHRADLDFGVTPWQFFSLLRTHVKATTISAVDTLTSISRLVSRIREMRVGKEVVGDVEACVDALTAAFIKRKTGVEGLENAELIDVWEKTKRASALADRAFFNPSMVGLLYFVSPNILAGAPSSNVSVTADNLVQCAESTISWTGGQAPYTLQISTGGFYVPTTALETHSSLSSETYSWKVTQKEGTGMFFLVTDAGGQVGYVQNIYVAASSDSSCLAAGSASSSSLSSSAPASTTASAAVAASTTANQVSATTSSRAAESSSAVAEQSPASSSQTSSSTPVAVVSSTSTSSSDTPSLPPFQSSSSVPASPTTTSVARIQSVATSTTTDAAGGVLTLTVTSSVDDSSPSPSTTLGNVLTLTASDGNSGVAVVTATATAASGGAANVTQGTGSAVVVTATGSGSGSASVAAAAASSGSAKSSSSRSSSSTRPSSASPAGSGTVQSGTSGAGMVGVNVFAVAVAGLIASACLF
ncbi:hypothetical protein QFC19_002486 [Naganishia cerealis]|uniref:Uncharacterized protein n=1 Tax=Naganishia cerealis TaxID=610337 RepID=A0ACC2W9V8_9TREE|nr:hypothetical protein QFC19_002486 [Naganishia cerealis]